MKIQSHHDQRGPAPGTMTGQAPGLGQSGSGAGEVEGGAFKAPSPLRCTLKLQGQNPDFIACATWPFSWKRKPVFEVPGLMTLTRHHCPRLDTHNISRSNQTFRPHLPEISREASDLSGALSPPARDQSPTQLQAGSLGQQE